MAKKINLNKNVFAKDKFHNAVDTSFNQLVPNPQIEESTFTVEDFFVEYENLFYLIPKEGEANSHRYLIERSREYVDFDLINAEIQALLDEIADLRQELLDANKQIIDQQVNTVTVNADTINAQIQETLNN